MFENEYIIIVLGMSLVTYLPRCIPLLALARRNLPNWLVEGLDLTPVAILSALLLPLLVTTGEPRHIELFRPELLVAIPTLLFALKTKSLSGTVILGMLLFWGASKVM
ncbi:MAG: AzlD domain-containing protein [Dehalococcoidia bacterium]|nr:AzlD domain-containing protein [Dehalococcoidia bacterium]